MQHINFLPLQMFMKLTKTLSIGEGEEFTWQLWKYNDRLSVASRVKAKQNELDTSSPLNQA